MTVTYSVNATHSVHVANGADRKVKLEASLYAKNMDHQLNTGLHEYTIEPGHFVLPFKQDMAASEYVKLVIRSGEDVTTQVVHPDTSVIIRANPLRMVKTKFGKLWQEAEDQDFGAIY
mmetsp:Transcript_3655/g.6525  ORF Transcript_3655/g.6525 Transcript_3655/m.6525 type:complete len:118 (+) Transcript_3655:56-409(+)